MKEPLPPEDEDDDNNPNIEVERNGDDIAGDKRAEMIQYFETLR